MAAPTPEQLYDFLVEHTAKYPGHVWYWNELANAARKNFASTTKAIVTRMNTLYADGKLVSVEVSYNGLVFWRGNDDDKLPYAYLDAYLPSEFSRLSHGEVVAELDPRRDNLWANGERSFYTVDTAYQALVEKFRALKEAQEAKRKQERFQERLEMRAALAEAAPQGDGMDLIKELRKLLPNSHVDARMFTSMSKPDEPSKMILSVDVRQPDLAAFLDILRTGIVLPEDDVDIDNVVSLNRS